jgi:hypothetical protein
MLFRGQVVGAVAVVALAGIDTEPQFLFAAEEATHRWSRTRILAVLVAGRAASVALRRRFALAVREIQEYVLFLSG